MRLFPALLLAACFSLPVMADSLEAEPASAEAIQATPGQQPGIYEGASRCELKRGVGKVERNPLATSGLSSRHEDRHQPVLEVQEELQGGSDFASPPSDKPEPLTAPDPS